MNNFIIGVIGAGQMGSGIATLCAVHGYQVRVIDSLTENLDKARLKTHQHLQAQIIPLEKISFHTDMSVLSGTDIVIEAVPEKIDLKHHLYKTLSTIVCKDTIIATNTSSFTISALSKSVLNPERFLGLHFMNPVLKMDLVEIIPSRFTSAKTLSAVKIFIDTLNKTTVVSDDQPGFIVNRLLIPMINQAFIALEQKLAPKEAIDVAMEKGAAFPMGPLKLADFIGLDTCLAIMNTLHTACPLAGYAPSTLLTCYVNNGKLGRKTKEGVYTY